MSFLERFKTYLRSLFKLVPPTKEAAELREAMLGDLMSRAMDLKESGNLSDDEIYDKCIESLGDYQPMLNELRMKPLESVKSPVFQRGLLSILTVALFAVVLYLVLAVSIPGFWGVGAYTIFPIAAVGILVIATATPLQRAFKLKRPIIAFGILSTYSAILCLGLFFILWLGAGISPGKTWVAFTYIPFLVAVSVAIATKLANKSIFIPVLFAIVILGIPLYLTAAVATGLWHPLWIIILAGVLIDIVLMIVKLNKKISLKEKETQDKNAYYTEDDVKKWNDR